VTRSLSTPADQVIRRVRATLAPYDLRRDRPRRHSSGAVPGRGTPGPSTWSPAPQRSPRASAWLRRYRSPSPSWRLWS